MSMSLSPTELTLADRVAVRIGRSWSEVEIEDLNSFLYLWLCENFDTVKRWRSEEGGEGKLYVSLRREAAKYCAKEQAIRVGRPIHAENYYNVSMLQRALPFIFEDFPQTTVAIDPRTSAPVHTVGADFNTAVTLLADIRGAFYGLNPEIRLTLEYRFRDGLTFEEIGELKSLTKDGAKKQVERAVERLSNALSGQKL